MISVKLTAAQVQQAAHFRNSDPALLSLYRQLRDTTVPPGQQSYPALNVVEEWDFVMKTIRTYIRAGCVALALDTGRVCLIPAGTIMLIISASTNMAIYCADAISTAAIKWRVDQRIDSIDTTRRADSEAIRTGCLPEWSPPADHHSL
jgi:hypothetical protein